MARASLARGMLADAAAEKSTPTYRAPELFDCTHLIPHCIGPETDLWSLGCLLYAMAFGRSPFEFGPRGSFERLAVMNASVHFARHTPGGLENQLWADHIGADPTQDVALAAEEVNRKIVQTPGFVRLVTRMLDPNPLTRLRLKEAVHMASWKVGKREEEEEVGASVAEEGEQNEPEHVDAEEEIEVRGEAIDMTDFAVDWETAVVETTPTKSKKKKKRKKKKKKKNVDGPVGSDHVNGSEVDDGKGESEGKETLEDSLTISEQELSMDEEDEFGDFATSPSPKGC